MSGYVRNTEFSIEFDGQTVTGSLSPLTLPDLLRMEAKDVSTDQDAAKVLAEILPTYVTGFSGLTDAAGTSLTIAEVCGLAYFIELSMAIGRKLVQAARPANPKQPSEPSAT
jgi:hypothetical protein